MKYTVYLRTNLVNGKQYVGQTGDIETREKQFNRIRQRYANKILTKDRQKYGLENFKIDILAETDNQEEAWSLEQKYIIELNTKYPNGYNMSDGGFSSKGTKHSEDSKNKMKEAAEKYWSCHESANKGIKLSEERVTKQAEIVRKYFAEHPEARKRLSDIAKQNIGEKNPFFGKQHKEETKKHWSEIRKGKHFSKETEFPSKTVYKYDLNYNLIEIYKTTAEAASKNGVSQSAIVYAVLYSKTHICKGWLYSYEPLHTPN